MLLLVHLLFLISIASLLVVIGAAAAIVHHIRISRHRQRISQAPPEPSFAEHLQAAAEYGTPQSARVVAAQSAQSISSRKDWNSGTKAEPQNDDTHVSRHRLGPQLIRRSAAIPERQDMRHSDTLQASPAPRLRVVAGNHIPTTRNQ